MTWVKVCGLRTEAEVAVAIDAGADAVGFVLAPSPRYVAADVVARLVVDVPVATYLVTVDLHPDEVEPLLRRTGATGLQPHGAHAVAAATVATLCGAQVLLPVPVTERVRPGSVGAGFRPLLDTPSVQHGGTGRSFDWALIDADGAEFVLAGGLGPDTVARAIAVVRPWGVDASSGLEARPGRKDPAKIRAFVAAATQTEDVT
ncbi:MAG: phosphoribosylanthranilate isomerase [Acidimicrobiia bacterium]